jgi:hypothetical protein
VHRRDADRAGDDVGEGLQATFEILALPTISFEIS